VLAVGFKTNGDAIRSRAVLIIGQYPLISGNFSRASLKPDKGRLPVLTSSCQREAGCYVRLRELEILRIRRDELGRGRPLHIVGGFSRGRGRVGREYDRSLGVGRQRSIFKSPESLAAARLGKSFAI
jgi:hypothetical protein